MCLILFAFKASPRFPLVLAANRDEFYDRAAAPAAFWSDAPSVLGGRDLKAGGTWLALNRDGRVAAVTNYREPGHSRPDAPSRGLILPRYLMGGEGAGEFLARLKPEAQAYNGFSLVLGAFDDLWFFSNRGGAPRPVAPGIHGLSNHLLDTPWPKVEHGREVLRSILATTEAEQVEAALFEALLDDSLPPDELLPRTGLPLDRERALAPLFVATPTYGTRSSSVLIVEQGGRVRFSEREFARGGRAPDPRRFVLEPGA